MNQPPPIPPHAQTLPPPPGPAPGKRPIFQRPVVIVGLVILGVAGLFVGGGALFVLTARDFTPSESQKACLVTAADVAEYFEFPVAPSDEEWISKKYIDGSLDIDYYFDSSHPDAPFINCTVTEDRKASDASGSYVAEWTGFKIGLKTAGGPAIDLVPADHLFKWGDTSRFVFLETGGYRYGFAFHGRLGSKIYFLSVHGVYWDDPDEIDAFLRPFLERFEREAF